MFMYEPPTKLKLTSVEGSQDCLTYICAPLLLPHLLNNERLLWFGMFVEFQEAFQLFDSRGDGKIHVAQIGDALRALGQNPTESDVKKCTLHLKPDERISFEVFLPIYQVRNCFK